jgi:hypothetical protein
VLQLDGAGYVIEPLDPRQRAMPLTQVEVQLPLLGGVNPMDLKTGHRVESPQVRVALNLIAEFEHSPMAGLVDLRRIDVSSPGVLTVTTGQGSEVTFGVQDLSQQLRRWRDVYDFGQRMRKAIASLDLAVSNNIPARWLEASAVPPPSPKALNTPTPRTKRKNV